MGGMSHSLSDLYRRFHNLLPRGTVAEVDNGAVPPVVRLLLNGRLTGWLPYPAEIGAHSRRWRPLRVGTQVQAACLSGDTTQAVIVQILYTDALPPPEAVVALVRDDGAGHPAFAFERAAALMGDGGGLARMVGVEIAFLARAQDEVLAVDDDGAVRGLEGHVAGRDHQHLAGRAVVADQGSVIPEDHVDVIAGFSPPKVTSPGEDG